MPGQMTMTFQFADVLLGGELEPKLRAWRTGGRSYEWIARELYVLTDRRVSVTHATVSDWFRQLNAV